MKTKHSDIISKMKIVFTNGCFDLLHVGHIDVLEQARALGDKLIVGLNSDESVRRLKGKSRPIMPQEQRKKILESLKCVDEVIIFYEDTPIELIKKIKPDILVKGHTSGEIIGKDLVPQAVLIKGRFEVSTSKLVEKIRS